MSKIVQTDSLTFEIIKKLKLSKKFNKYENL